MKKIMLYVVLVASFAGCNSDGVDEAHSLQHFSQIDSLLQRKQFFAARDTYQVAAPELTRFHQLRVGAELDNVFNRLQASNGKIDSLLNNYANKLSDKDKYHLFRLRQMNHSKLFEYKEANDALDQMLTHYKKEITEDEIKDFQNTKKIWASLVNQPKQIVAMQDNTTLPITINKLGLPTLLLKHDTVAIDFIFDTGANFSTVTESVAKKLSMQLMDTTVIDVGSITGEKVKSRIGICPEFNLGSIKVQNAVFLVFPDAALSIPQANFQINGILGFPVIEAMKEIQLTKAGQFIVPLKKSTHSGQNMAINFLTPVILLDGENYTFDSGANATTLYDNYFIKHKNSIEPAYKETDLTIGGAGGSKTKKGYYISFKTTVNGQPVMLDSVQLFKESLKNDNYFPGNMGQDLIKKFDKWTINFESMFIKFD